MNTVRTSTEAPRCILCGCSLDPEGHQQHHMELTTLNMCERCFQRCLRAMKGQP